ncbi:MAG TPA: SIS domain-containing protein [Candidatus Lokiarchaeia archaeon]|nr:SIS domain-containing protein [Candidatus Lokiarchaeia archaeon]
MKIDISGYSWDQLRSEFSFVNDVFDEPEALKQFANYYTSIEGKSLLLQLNQDWKETRFENVIITGMGSSLFAGHIASMIFQAAGFPCAMIDAGELLYYGLGGDESVPASDNAKTLFILTSQSGESVEIVKLLDEIPAKRPDGTIWGITNTEDSVLAIKSHRAILLKAGEERSVTAKTFSNTLLMMYILPRILIATSETEIDAFLNTFFDDVQGLADDLEFLFSEKQELANKIVTFFGKDTKFVEVIARGTSLATAQQAALNIKETNKIASEAISGGQFRHGPIELVTKNFSSICLASDDETRDLMEDVCYNITHKWGGGKVLFITNRQSEKLEGDARLIPVVHNCINPFLAPVMEIAIIQLFMIRLAASNNIGPGIFKYTTKVTKIG